MWYVVYSISYACRSCTKCSLRENILSILYVTIIKWRKKRNLSTTRETIFETKTSIMKELYNKETLIFSESGFSYTLNIVGSVFIFFSAASLMGSLWNKLNIELSSNSRKSCFFNLFLPCKVQMETSSRLYRIYLRVTHFGNFFSSLSKI